MLSMSSSTGGMIWRVLCKPASDKIAESIIEPVGAIINRPTAGIALSLQSDVEKDMYVVGPGDHHPRVAAPAALRQFTS